MPLNLPPNFNGTIILKYVMIDHTLPVVFGEYFKHSDFANVHGTITSAGKVAWDISQRMAVTYGESVSLKLKPDPNDAFALTRLFFADHE
jgi:hypothetical protein